MIGAPLLNDLKKGFAASFVGNKTRNLNVNLSIVKIRVHGCRMVAPNGDIFYRGNVCPGLDRHLRDLARF